MHEYETMIVIRPDLDDPVTTGILDKLEGVISGNGGDILLRDDWGKRKLAYPIKRHLKGHYVRLEFLAPPSIIKELERNIRIEDAVMRFLTVSISERVDVATRKAQAEATRLRLAEERAAREVLEAEQQAQAAAMAELRERNAAARPPEEFRAEHADESVVENAEKAPEVEE